MSKMGKALSILIKATFDSSGFSDAYSKIKGFAGKVGGVVSGIWDGVKKVGGWLAGIGAVIVGGLTLSIREAMKVEDEMDKLNAILATTAANSGFTADSLAKQREELKKIVPVAEDVAIALQAAFLRSGALKGEEELKNFSLAAIGLAKQLGGDAVSAAEDLAGALTNTGKAAKFLTGIGAELTNQEKTILEYATKTNDKVKVQELVFSKLSLAMKTARDAGKGFGASWERVTNGFKSTLAIIGSAAIKVLELEDLFNNFGNSLGSLASNPKFIAWIEKVIGKFKPFKDLLEGIMELARGNIEVGEMKIQGAVQGITKLIVDALIIAGKKIAGFMLEVAPMFARAIKLGILGKVETPEELEAWYKRTKMEKGIKAGGVDAYELTRAYKGIIEDWKKAGKSLWFKPAPTHEEQLDWLVKEKEAAEALRKAITEGTGKIKDTFSDVAKIDTGMVAPGQYGIQQQLMNATDANLINNGIAQDEGILLLQEIRDKLTYGPEGAPDGLANNVSAEDGR